jgi:hypothetical protein
MAPGERIAVVLVLMVSACAVAGATALFVAVHSTLFPPDICRESVVLDLEHDRCDGGASLEREGSDWVCRCR